MALTPYYEHGGITIYCCDCRDILPHITADCVITDPPYIWNDTTGAPIKTRLSDDWGYGGMLRQADVTAGLAQIEFDDWIPLVASALKDPGHCYVFTNDKNIHKVVGSCAKAHLRLHNVLVWKKNNCTPNHWYMKNCEFVVFSHKGKAFPINDISKSHFFEMPNIRSGDKSHPTEKPVELMAEFVVGSTSIGGTVLDPFAGSGTTLIAAARHNRKAIGIEIEERYCEIAAKRLSQEVLPLEPADPPCTQSTLTYDEAR